MPSLNQDPEGIIRHALSILQDDIHETAVKSGWWEDYDSDRAAAYNIENEDDSEETCKRVDLMYKLARTMLAVTELSEGVESLRRGDPPDDMLTQYSGYTVELADTMIRILDLARQFELPIVDAIIAKIDYNKSRSYKHGGKSI